MKTKLYYGILALLWLLTGCVSAPPNDMTVTAQDRAGNIYTKIINNHQYIYDGGGIAHSGNCKQCKHELDSLINVSIKEALKENMSTAVIEALNTAIEANNKENWNE